MSKPMSEKQEKFLKDLIHRLPDGGFKYVRSITGVWTSIPDLTSWEAHQLISFMVDKSESELISAINSRFEQMVMEEFGC